MTLEAKSLVTCSYAPKAYGLPYNYAKEELPNKATLSIGAVQEITEDLELIGNTEIYGNATKCKTWQFGEFLFERYCLYTNKNGKIMRGYTHHKKWTFQPAKSKHTLKFAY